MLKSPDHFKLYTDSSGSTEFTNSTEISIADNDGTGLGFGFALVVHNDKFWNRNFTIYAKLTTLGQVSILK